MTEGVETGQGGGREGGLHACAYVCVQLLWMTMRTT